MLSAISVDSAALLLFGVSAAKMKQRHKLLNSFVEGKSGYLLYTVMGTMERPWEGMRRKRNTVCRASVELPLHCSR